MKKKRIILYCDCWKNGGIESYLMSQVRHWNLSEMDCVILSAEKGNDAYDSELREYGISQIVLLDKSYPPVLRTLRTFKKMKQFLREQPCDVIYYNLANSVGLRYAKIAKKAGVNRRIVHSHSAGIQPSLTRKAKLLAHILAKKLYTQYATDWWTCSDQAGQFLFDPCIEQYIQYIPNAIETKKFSFNMTARNQIRQKIGIGEDVILLGTVGRFVTQKNQSFLFDVIAALCERGINIKLLLVGNGPLHSELQKRAMELGLNDCCIFWGQVDNTAPLYCAIDIFCLPSLLEGNPISAMEAQTAGCICLLADTITKQAAITNNVLFLQLKCDVWCQRVLETCQKKNSIKERISAAQAMRNAGMDIKCVAEKVQSLICEK